MNQWEEFFAHPCWKILDQQMEKDRVLLIHRLIEQAKASPDAQVRGTAAQILALDKLRQMPAEKAKG